MSDSNDAYQLLYVHLLNNEFQFVKNIPDL